VIVQTLEHSALDCRDHAFEMICYFAVPKSDHIEALPVEPRRSALIVSALDIVVAAINFHDEPGRQTDEIHDVDAQSELSAEADSMYLLEPKMAPQQPLRFCRVGSQCAARVGIPLPLPPPAWGGGLFDQDEGFFITPPRRRRRGSGRSRG
jgi:hypothetical protein